MINFVHTVGIMMYLLFLVRYVAKGEKAPRLQTKSWRVVAEVLYVLISSLITLGYAMLLLLNNNYGLAGYLSLFKPFDEDCHLTLTNLLQQILSGYVFSVLGSVISIVMLIAVAVVYSRLPLTLREARLLLRKISIIIVCYLIFNGIVLIAFSMI